MPPSEPTPAFHRGLHINGTHLPPPLVLTPRVLYEPNRSSLPTHFLRTTLYCMKIPTSTSIHPQCRTLVTHPTEPTPPTVSTTPRPRRIRMELNLIVRVAILRMGAGRVVQGEEGRLDLMVPVLDRMGPVLDLMGEVLDRMGVVLDLMGEVLDRMDRGDLLVIMGATRLVHMEERRLARTEADRLVHMDERRLARMGPALDRTGIVFHPMNEGGPLVPPRAGVTGLTPRDVRVRTGVALARMGGGALGFMEAASARTAAT
jgi:hypothetical protein